jgi:hypothetical protein
MKNKFPGCTPQGSVLRMLNDYNIYETYKFKGHDPGHSSYWISKVGTEVVEMAHLYHYQEMVILEKGGTLLVQFMVRI